MPNDTPRAPRLAHSQVGQIFIAVTIIVLAIFMVVTWNVLGKIGEESRRTGLFLDSWLSAKADFVALMAAPESVEAASVRTEIDRCDRIFKELAKASLIDSATRIGGGRIGKILPLWSGLRESIRVEPLPAGEGRPGAPARVAALLALSASFESALRDRLVSIAGLEFGQNRAFLTLLVSIFAAMVALVVGSALLAVSAARDRAGRMRLEDLMGATLAAQEAERTRIALDLHDSVSQDLAATLMVARRLAADGSGSKDLVIRSVQTAIDSLRRISWDMRPPELERLGFRGAALDLAESFARHAGLELDVSLNDYDSNGPSVAVSLHLYRILQEALANIRRHARASRIGLSLSEIEGRYRLEIRDDGIGFDRLKIDSGRPGPAHLGVAGMKERARLAGGDLEIETAPRRGTRLCVEVPLG